VPHADKVQLKKASVNENPIITDPDARSRTFTKGIYLVTAIELLFMSLCTIVTPLSVRRDFVFALRGSHGQTNATQHYALSILLMRTNKK
jgi:hypothetical protein